MKIPLDVPWKDLKKKQRDAVLHGTGEREYEVSWQGKRGGKARFVQTWEGALPRLMRRFRDTGSERAKRYYGQFLADRKCSACGGARLRAESAAVRLGEISIVELSSLTVDDALAFFARLKFTGAAKQIATEVLKEIRARLRFLTSVGLGYLSLDRPGPSLSGGEAQRIRLASQVGSDLTGVIYIFFIGQSK